MNAERKTIAAVVTTMRMLANENRLRILYALHKRSKTWTELKDELQINPKALKHHLDYLKKNKLITDRKPEGFELTEAGSGLMELSIDDVISTVREAKRIMSELS